MASLSNRRSMPSTAPRFVAAFLGLVVGLVGLTACAEAEPDGFTADNRSGFLAACTRPLEDSRLTSAICQCVFDETLAQLAFQEFEQLEAGLLADPEADLPPELSAIVARCVVEETDL